MTVVESVCPVAAALGEGPVWIDDALWFVDIKAPCIHRFDPADGGLRTWPAPAQVGWVLPAKDGRLIAGLQTGLHSFDPATGAFTLLGPVEPTLPGNRLNDAAVDPAGRLWFGSMDDGESALTGHIYRADARGIARMVSGIAITNGPAVSPDGTRLYHNDTLGGLVHRAAIAADGSLSDAGILARIDPADGYPDGPAVDSEGCLWIGLYGGWGVRRYDPDGQLMRTIRFPVANITKIAFGGPDLRTAYATTANKQMSRQDHDAQPLAGNLFAFDPGVAGLPCPRIAPFATDRQYD